MANIATVKPQEDFIVDMNGDYNIPFDEMTITGAFAAGTIMKDASTQAGEDDAVIGILAQATKSGSNKARVMVRGNPTTVNAQALPNYNANHKAKLEAVGIVVVND